MARARASSLAVEVFYAPADARAVVSQHGVEVWYDWAAASPTTITGVGVSQYGVEVFYAPADARAVVSQHGVEVFYAEASAEDPGGTPAPVTHAFGYAV
jgi:hypothetical protein